MEQEKKTQSALQGALAMVQKRKLSVAGIQMRCKTVLDSKIEGAAAEADKKFVVKVHEDLEQAQNALKVSEQNLTQMLLTEGTALEDKVAYLQLVANKMKDLSELSQPRLTSQDDRIGGIGSMCPWGVGLMAIWALQEQCKRYTGRHDSTAVHFCTWD